MSNVTLKAQFDGKIDIITKDKRGTEMKIYLPLG